MFRISVIIPAFNRAALLPRALDSVLAQQYAAHEIIVVDDGSSDDTTALLRRRYPGVTCIRQPRQGVSAARNTGIRAASGDWLAFLDSDDAWLPHKLQRLCAALQAAPDYRIAHSDEIWIRHGRRVNAMNKHRKYGGMIFPHTLRLCTISPSAVMIARTLLAQVGLFDEELPACEDYDMWLRICSRHPVLYVDEPLICKYGGHHDQLSKKYWGMDRFRIQALRKIIDSGTLAEEHGRAAAAMLTEKARIYLQGARKRGRLAEARDYEQLIARYGSP